MGVNHLRGHVASAELNGFEIEFPSLLLSGLGRSHLLAMMDDGAEFRLLGETATTQSVEAYDKVLGSSDWAIPAVRSWTGSQSRESQRVDCRR